MIDEALGFTLVRLLDATPEALWAAWTEEDELAQWWHPTGARTPRESVHVDLRVGGGYTYTMVDEASGNEVVTGGVYLEITPITKLRFTWGEPDADPDDSPVVTVTIEPLGDLTRLTFDLRGVEGSAGDQFFFDGWASALDVLVEHLGQNEVRG
ncbi:SRPBCC domain-containing protein [Microbacteriaceae bacterium VKM Ac-2855]|nr:SRPBCC domain-containing protein [Microbacteriaceae bacterium VKM Ac-2855]